MGDSSVEASEKDKTITVYIGTTLENFRACAYVLEGGHVMFDKTRVPEHKTDATMWVYGLSGVISTLVKEQKN